MRSRITKGRKNMGRQMVVRVTKTEFELADGRIFPNVVEFQDDEVPTVEEFQKVYDQWRSLFSKLKLTGEPSEQTAIEHK